MNNSNIVVNIPIVLDTKAIEEKAASAAIREIGDRLVTEFFKSTWSSDSKITKMVYEKVNELLELEKEDITTKAVDKIADRLCRSSKFREKVAGELNGTVHK